MVNAKINKTQVQQTRVNKKPHIESASSKIAPSLYPPIDFDIDVNIEKESLFRNRFIIIGSIKTIIEIIAITPQEFFIKERLEVTVRSASLTDEPTRGTKLLMAKRAVFIEILSTL